MEEYDLCQLEQRYIPLESAPGCLSFSSPACFLTRLHVVYPQGRRLNHFFSLKR